MELLFNETIDIKEIYLSFLDVDIDFNKLKPKLITASNDVIGLIGKEMYALALVEFKKEAAEEKNLDIIFNIANPIAIQAYRKYAPHNDLSHTTKGRLNRVEDNEKSPFQWMIENDNNALERSYYEALDDLIKYLDSSIVSWKETSAYKATHGLFLNSPCDFDTYFPIGNSRLLFLKLAPGIRRAETREIKSRLGSELYTSLKEPANGNEALLDKVREACVYSALAWSMRRLSVQLFPEGVLQGFSSERMTQKATKAPENNEAFAVARYFESDAKDAFLELEVMVTEMNKKEDEQIAPIVFKADSNDGFISI
ncbi:DUF6712 family protein [Flavicella sp.]|uniref:DUF6712 family protein n=1 Tax=Flavicella sp. TaxID=2957742 RepID=UPI0030168431